MTGPHYTVWAARGRDLAIMAGCLVGGRRHPPSGIYKQAIDAFGARASDVSPGRPSATEWRRLGDLLRWHDPDGYADAYRATLAILDGADVVATLERFRATAAERPATDWILFKYTDYGARWVDRAKLQADHVICDDGDGEGPYAMDRDYFEKLRAIREAARRPIDPRKHDELLARIRSGSIWAPKPERAEVN